MIDQNKQRIPLAVALLIGNLAVIWGNSLLPGEISGAISGWVHDCLSAILHLPGGPSGAGHGLLRKLAHFSEFACLGMVLTWLLQMLEKPAPLALIGGFAAACVDETIQIFVPHRGPAFTDVLIDTSGVLTGLCLLLLVSRLRGRKKPTEQKSNM